MAQPERTGTPTGSEKKRRIEEAKKRETRTGLAIVLAIVILVAGAGLYYTFPHSPSSSTTTSSGSSGTAIPDPTLTTCINEGALAEHIHATLSIVVSGQQVPIPANIGVTPGCTRPVHTHDASGEIHVESPVIYPYTVKDFFLVWQRPFDNTQILQYKIDSSHTIRMTVNGAVNTEFQNYVFHDGDVIQITYGPFT